MGAIEILVIVWVVLALTVAATTWAAVVIIRRLRS